MEKTASLPRPDAEALEHSSRLAALIRARIEAAGGWLPFDRYMELALYAPGLGYYSGGATKFGGAGDFTTAPEMTPFFGRTVARQIAEVLEHLAATDSAETIDGVLEFGAGSGALAADLLLELDALGVRCLHYRIVELSGELRARQRDAIVRRCAQAGRPQLADAVQWLEALPARFCGVMIGNEVLDAMPVRLFARRDSVWHERGVVADDSGFAWQDRRPDCGKVPAVLAEVPGHHDYLTETHEAATAFVRTVAGVLERGMLLLIDYGFPVAEYYHAQRDGGTLMGHYRHHSHGDPFLYPGLTDITAHVEFTGIALAGDEAGLELLGYTSQARFLMNAGIAELLAQLDASDARAFVPVAGTVQKLLSEAEMGELFKVIALGRGIDWLPRGFAAGDRSARL